MMENVQNNEQERGVLRWGGTAGLLGGFFFILTWIVVGAGPVGMEEPADLAGWVMRFPEVRIARIVENGLYLAGLILGVALFLALYRALRDERLAPALFGSVVGILGLGVMMVGALPHIATAPISDLYHAAEATAVDQAALALIWQGTQGIFDAILATGFIIVPVGITSLGLAMLPAHNFGKGLGWFSLLLGLLGLIAAVLNMVNPSMVGAGSFFAIVIFYFVMGWKVYKMSRASADNR